MGGSADPIQNIEDLDAYVDDLLAEVESVCTRIGNEVSDGPDDDELDESAKIPSESPPPTPPAPADSSADADADETEPEALAPEPNDAEPESESELETENADPVPTAAMAADDAQPKHVDQPEVEPPEEPEAPAEAQSEPAPSDAHADEMAAIDRELSELAEELLDEDPAAAEAVPEELAPPPRDAEPEPESEPEPQPVSQPTPPTDADAAPDSVPEPAAAAVSETGPESPPPSEPAAPDPVPVEVPRWRRVAVGVGGRTGATASALLTAAGVKAAPIAARAVIAMSKPLDRTSEFARRSIGWFAIYTAFLALVLWAFVLAR